MTHSDTNEAEIMALKEGDAVLVWGHSCLAERTVTRVTATQVLVGETRYRRTGGFKAGRELGRSTGSNARIKALTPARRAAREAVAKRARLEIDAQNALEELRSVVRSPHRSDEELQSFIGYVQAAKERGIPKRGAR